jgi:hypothetical protein
LPVSHHRCLGSIQGRGYVGFVADKVALGEVLFEYFRFLLSESWSFGGKQCFIINHNICEILLVINVTMQYATY